MNDCADEGRQQFIEFYWIGQEKGSEDINVRSDSGLEGPMVLTSTSVLEFEPQETHNSGYGGRGGVMWSVGRKAM
jgi:hypothetical protein